MSMFLITSVIPQRADGILGRLVHNAHRIEMHGDSMCKKRGLQRVELDARRHCCVLTGALSSFPAPLSG
jgi:hypothetical protein